MFSKNLEGKWCYNQKDAVEYVLRVTEKLLTKKIEKDCKHEALLEDTRTTNTDKKSSKYKKIKKSDDVNYKIFKVYNILDDLLNKYKKDKEIWKILKNPFKVIIF